MVLSSSRHFSPQTEGSLYGVSMSTYLIQLMFVLQGQDLLCWSLGGPVFAFAMATVDVEQVLRSISTSQYMRLLPTVLHHYVYIHLIHSYVLHFDANSYLSDISVDRKKANIFKLLESSRIVCTIPSLTLIL